ncbi:MAG TPA: adenylate/guanylate cyclase domain-containing protein [Desulfomonilaceae bacterium]|nr:adenylate/guanylate cyclase domain-containing protein [Desulfomonilaceae bacterium]
MYKERFENIFRVARRVTSSLNIADILESIRDECKTTMPHLQEMCLMLVDSEAQHYTRPLHCSMRTENINCQFCKKGRNTILKALDGPARTLCFVPGPDGGKLLPEGAPAEGLCEIVLPIYEGNEPLAVLEAVAKEGSSLGEKELTLLNDLAELVANVLKNARHHWKISQEKLTLDRILERLRPFVPATVQKILEKDPEAPALDKTEMDVTILFLDVAGYTRISEYLTQEKVNFIIEKYFSSFLDALYAHGGDINETAGDGLMAIFQGDRKNHAFNAARAALEIRRKTMEINQELEKRFQPLQINMGINSGEASLGMRRFQGAAGTRMTFTASGPVTNLAARIASAAKDGDILIGSETANRIREEIILFDRGAMVFKNIAKPVKVFSLVRPTDN